jgi:hypothetical protein
MIEEPQIYGMLVVARIGAACVEASTLSSLLCRREAVMQAKL